MVKCEPGLINLIPTKKLLLAVHLAVLVQLWKWVYHVGSEALRRNGLGSI